MEQKKRKRRKKRTKKRSAISKVGLFFLILLLVLLLLGITVSAGWLWMNYSGQSRLSQKQEAVPELMQQAESEAESEMMLEAGSIRYHGKVYTYKKDILTFLFLGIDKKSNRQSKRANKKISEYGLQLREKQKAKFIYGVLEKPFHNYYEKADRMKGMTGANLMTILESRLDNVVFRLGLARTRKEARQIVDHKHVLVNGKCVNIPSYLVKAGDTIEIKENAKSSQRYKDILEVTAGRLVPEWLDVDQENLKGEVKELPTREMIDVPVDEMLIVELYSK